MKFVIIFFRDILDGPLYIITAIIAGILICSCIGYLAEQAELKKKQEQEEEQYVDVDQLYDSNNGTNTNTNTTTTINSNNTVSNTNDIKTQDI